MATAVHSADGTYELDNATFGEVEARLVLEDGDAELEASTTVESVSIADPPEFREHVVRGDDFFAADTHPLLTFRSSSIELGRDGRDPFGDTRVGLELAATVDRRTWGIDWQMPLPNGGDALGWDVTITMHLELIKVP